jgi:hypothetical protein
MWVCNTLRVAELACSAAYLAEARSHADLEVLSDLMPMPLDENGNLPDCVFDDWQQ